ncbi:MAG: DNA polymerase III epsilon subunit family exonuclease [Myxococcota bacterium]|jgi:DNA polymerase III epsilon subunit family exonuclease
MSSQHSYIVFDTETTGMPPGARIIEIGALKIVDNEIVDTFELLLNPECEIPFNVIRVHGIDNSMVASAPNAAEALPAFFEWIGDMPLVGHNVSFDAAMLASEAWRAAIRVSKNNTYCTLSASRKLLKRKSNALSKLVVDLELPNQVSHRALADAENTFYLLRHIIDAHGADTCWGKMGNGAPLRGFMPSPVKLPERFQALQEAVAERECVSLDYRLANGRHYQIKIHPRLIYKSGQRTIIEAVCDSSGITKTYLLDSILAIHKKIG